MNAFNRLTCYNYMLSKNATPEEIEKTFKSLESIDPVIEQLSSKQLDDILEVHFYSAVYRKLGVPNPKKMDIALQMSLVAYMTSRNVDEKDADQILSHIWQNRNRYDLSNTTHYFQMKLVVEDAYRQVTGRVL